jgi:ribosome biogenesis protein
MLNTPSPVPLDFLINGNFLRTTLEEYLKTNGLSIESTVNVEYVRSLLPPVYEASFENDDWISAVDVLSATSSAGRWSGASFPNGQDRVLSASYDGLVRIWNRSGKIMATSAAGSKGGHTMRLNAAKFLSHNQVVSTGLDQKVMVWEYTEAADHLSGELKPTLELYGHMRMVNSLDVHGSNKRMLTACSDGHIGLWTSKKGSAPEVDPDSLPPTYTNKRPKLSAIKSSPPKRGPLAMIRVHESPANDAIFHPNDATVAYSVADDRTLKTIDLTTSKTVSTFATLHPLLCVCALSGNTPLLAAGSTARHINLMDPRADAKQTSVMTLRGHVNMVRAIATSPDNDYSLLSGSHDSTCLVWDLRSVRPATKAEGGGQVSEPVYRIGREWLDGKLPPAGDGAKVLSCTWDKTWGIVSGGEDKKLQINRGRDIVS